MPQINACTTTATYVVNNPTKEIALPIDTSTIATKFALDIVNEILENAMDAATTKSSLTNPAENLCNTYKKTLKDDTNFLQRINMANNMNNNNQSIRELVEGICMNTRLTMNAEEPLRINVETKRFVNEIMSPTSDSTCEAATRKNGVGDQPSNVDQSNINDPFNDGIVEDIENTRIVEKKSRVTDLVMNSKQVLTPIFLNDEEKKKQDDWEESKENVIQVIDLDCVLPDDMDKLIERVKITAVDSTNDDIDEKETFTPIPKDDTLELIDLTVQSYKDVEEQKISCLKENHHDGKGDEFKNIQVENLAPRISKTLPSSSTQSQQQLEEEVKKEKRKKWSVGKIWGFFKKHINKHPSEKNDNVEDNGE